MIASSSLAAAAGSPAEPVALDGSGTAMPRPGVVLLWASWCVPCRGELKRLPELATAASPLPISLLALEPAADTRKALRGVALGSAAAFVAARPAAVVLARWKGTTLPLAVAIDAHGRVCGRKTGLLGADQLRDWARRCS